MTQDISSRSAKGTPKTGEELEASGTPQIDPKYASTFDVMVTARERRK